MPFPVLPSQAEINAQLRRAKPRSAAQPTLPWGPALLGLSLFITLRWFL